MPEPSVFDVELAVEKLKSHKSPGIDQISAELITAEGRTIRHEFHKIIISIRNKEEFPVDWDESFVLLFISMALTTCSNYRGLSLLPTT